MATSDQCEINAIKTDGSTTISQLDKKMDEIADDSFENAMKTEDATNSPVDKEMEKVADLVNKKAVFTAPSDPFDYVNKIHTNEKYKLHVTHIPRHVGYQAFKKKLALLGLSPSKFKLLSKHNNGPNAHAFVVFRSQEELDAGFKALDSLQWKSCTLECKHAKPAADPFIVNQQKKRKLDTKKESKNVPAIDPTVERLKNARDMEEGARREELAKLLCEVTEPWCGVDYEEQLKKKTESMKAIVQPLLSEGVEFREICGSPQVDFYRNKIEFTVGYGIDELPTVGFRLGSYRFGSCWVVRPEAGACKIIPPVLCNLALAFEEFLRSGVGSFRPFNQVTHDGNYRFFTTRINSAGQVLGILSVFTGNLTSTGEELDKERKALCSFFGEEKRKELGVVGLLWNSLSQGSSTDDFGKLSSASQVIFGESSIIEEVCGLKFKISPQSFFQINTPCTEVLYSTIRNFTFQKSDVVKDEPADAESNKRQLVLDLCCGTGTIGIVLLGAKNVDVVGIEMNESAVEDAGENVALNNLPSSNIKFICGKVESAIYSVLGSRKNEASSIVAVLDPPRAGVHTSVIMTIRRTEAIKRLIYVSCNPSAAFANFEDLTRLPSRRLLGEPFSLKCVVPVDLFPHTPHCEMVLLFER